MKLIASLVAVFTICAGHVLAQDSKPKTATFDGHDLKITVPQGGKTVGQNSAGKATDQPFPPGPNPNSQYRLGPDSLAQEGVPKGEIRGPYILPSKVYAGTQHTYWVYVPAQYDPAVPAALMIYQDGQAFKDENGDIRAQNVMDNLIYRREHVYPERVLAGEKKPIRIFLCDGRNDNRGIRNGVYDEKRDWFLQNVRLMNALKQKGYDVNYTWGMNLHGQKFGGAIMPEMMRWLWRDGPVSTDPKDMIERSFRQPAAKKD